MFFYLRLAYTAVRSLESHFLRSLLATVGVTIGVGSVVACMSIIEGATGRVLRNLKSLGSNLIFVQPATARVEGRRVGVAQTLEIDDMHALEQDLGAQIAAIAPVAMDVGVPVKFYHRSDDFYVIATSDAYFEMNEYAAAVGRTFSRSESQDDTALVACLGSKVAEKLLGGMQAVGETIKIRSASFRVVGVMEPHGNIGFLDADKTVYVPIRAGLRRYFNRKWLNFLMIQSAPETDVQKLKLAVQKSLRKAHNLRVGQPNDFEVDTLEDAVREFSQAAMIFRVVFYSIAGISLLVGGIGIMNIMLVSVTERTREIGVRMAVGARRGDILVQFLVEALIISLLGGAFGLLLGAMFADLLDKILQGMFHTSISADVVTTALITTTIVGVASGIYPAYKASRLDPVEALRYE